MPQNIKQIATIGGGVWIDPHLGWKDCQKSLGIEGLSSWNWPGHSRSAVALLTS